MQAATANSWALTTAAKSFGSQPSLYLGELVLPETMCPPKKKTFKDEESKLKLETILVQG